jgi:hypothetical protein
VPSFAVVAVLVTTLPLESVILTRIVHEAVAAPVVGAAGLSA